MIGDCKGIIIANSRRLQSMEDKVRHREHIWEWLILGPLDGFIERCDILDRIDRTGSADMFDGIHEESSRSARRIHDGFAELRIDHLSHEFRDGARRIEFSRTSGTLEFAENVFIDVSE